MALVSGLVPARFLTLTAHLVIVITIFWSRDNNVLASLPLQYSQQQYQRQDVDIGCSLQRLHLSLLLRLGALGERHLLVHPGLLQRPACCLRDPALRVRLRVQEEAPVSRSRAPREVCTAGPTGSEPGGGYAGRGARQRSPLLLSPTDLALAGGSW
ncbi:transmembrane protein 107 isoform X2 [Malaclemys terrapin pileata]|uniref:transmembrane protein 107 isoform X2 n=1 Tax=Malaclemys terrapin pileata TaxID=2991368 RepID=UPI0023A79DA1|nr:transmembrane protein 107 isoform X2 [Malaclemys terrapin pileata]